MGSEQPINRSIETDRASPLEDRGHIPNRLLPVLAEHELTDREDQDGRIFSACYRRRDVRGAAWARSDTQSARHSHLIRPVKDDSTMVLPMIWPVFCQSCTFRQKDHSEPRPTSRKMDETRAKASPSQKFAVLASERGSN